MHPTNHRYLKGDVKIQPLFARWPIWPHLVAPAQSAMNLAFRYLPNLQSFVTNPSVHVSAAHDPEMYGGPFIALSEADVPSVKQLIARTRRDFQPLLEFAEELRAFNERFQREAKGYKLDEFYGQLPRSLRGLVELVYDLNNHPSIRMIEPLLYEAMKGSIDQWELCLHRRPDIDRPFFMGAPLLDDSERLIVPLSPSDGRLDALCAMRIAPGNAQELAELLQLEQHDRARFDACFTDERPQRRADRYAGDGVRLRYFGHACVLFETRQAAVLFDPVCAWERSEEASLVFADLPDRIDAIVLTHSHQDHCHPEFLLQLRRRTDLVLVPANDAGNLADPSLRLMLRHLGFQHVQAMDAFDVVQIADCTVTSLPFVGEHAGLNINSKHCLLLAANDRKALFLVDSDLLDAELCNRLAAHVGPVDTMFIGMECHGAPLSWLYGPLLSKPATRRDDDSRRLSGADSQRAWRALQAFKCKRVFIYAMGQESWLRSLMGLQYQPGCVQLRESERLIGLCHESGVAARRLSGCTELQI